MVKCCVFSCQMSSHYNIPEITFHRLPKDANKSQIWLKMINRNDWKPKPTSVVCSKHFEPRYLVKLCQRTVLHHDAVPTLCMDSSEDVKEEKMETDSENTDEPSKRNSPPTFKVASHNSKAKIPVTRGTMTVRQARAIPTLFMKRSEVVQEETMETYSENIKERLINNSPPVYKVATHKSSGKIPMIVTVGRTIPTAFMKSSECSLNDNKHECDTIDIKEESDNTDEPTPSNTPLAFEVPTPRSNVQMASTEDTMRAKRPIPTLLIKISEVQKMTTHGGNTDKPVTSNTSREFEFVTPESKMATNEETMTTREQKLMKIIEKVSIKSTQRAKTIRALRAARSRASRRIVKLERIRKEDKQTKTVLLKKIEFLENTIKDLKADAVMRPDVFNVAKVIGNLPISKEDVIVFSV